jgi:tetratricopeptide (TPR) repeat protein
MSEIAPRDTPYKGLVPYDEADAPFFFGRDPEREIITANLMGSRLTLVYGPSGVGKSSVLRAGVVHRLRLLAREELAARGRPKLLIVFFNSWRDDPLAGLRARIRERVAEALGSEPPLCVLPATPLADELQLWAECVGGKLLVVLDQFEEYFLYPQREGEGSFAEEFALAVNRPDVRANFIISLREDWLAKLDRFKITIPNLFDNYLRVEWLTGAAARIAIEQPVAKYNELRSNGEPEVRIADGFSAKVIEQLGRLAYRDALAESPGGEAKGAPAAATPIQTPYLQLVMTQLWVEALRDEKHVLHPDMLRAPLDPEKAETRAEEIVQSHLDGVMKELSEAEQDMAARAFYHLVTPGGTKIALSIGDLVGFTTVAREQLEPVLTKLSGKEMSVLSQLTPPPNQPTEIRYEIFHDVLAPAILAWRARFMRAKATAEVEAKARAEAKKALERELAERQAAEQRRELEQARALFEAERQRAEEQTRRVKAEQQRADEQKRHARRLWGMVAGLAVVALLATVAAASAFMQRQRAITSEGEALKKGQEAVEYARQSEDLRKEAGDLRKEAGELQTRAAELRAEAAAAQQKAAEQERRAHELLLKANAAEAEAVKAQAEARTERGRVEQAKEEALKAQHEAEVSKRAADISQQVAQSFLARAREAEASAKDARAASMLILQALDEGTKPALKEIEEKVLPGLRGAEDKAELASALRLIGGRYAILREPAEAERFYQMALPLYQSLPGRSAELASVHIGLADIYRRSNSPEAKEQALAAYRAAAAAYRTAGERDREADTRVRLARLLFMDSNEKIKSTALEEFNAALALYRPPNEPDRRKEADMLNSIGSLYNSTDSRQDELQSVEFYKQAARAYDDFDPLLAAQARVEVGNIYSYADSEPTVVDKEEAIKAYKAALDFYGGKEEYRPVASGTLRKIATLYLSLGKKDQAVAEYNKAANLYLKAGLPINYAVSLNNIIRLYESDGRPEEKRKALPYYWCQVEAFSRTSGNWSGRATALKGISAIYASLGEKKKAEEFSQCAADAASQRAHTCRLPACKDLQ